MRPLLERSVEIWHSELIHSFILLKLSSESCIIEKLKFVWNKARCLLPEKKK